MTDNVASQFDSVSQMSSFDARSIPSISAPSTSFESDRNYSQINRLPPIRSLGFDSLLPCSTCPIFQKFEMMSKILSNPEDSQLIKVIAVDGYDPKLVESMIDYLSKEVSTMGNVVRVFDDDEVREVIREPTDLKTYKQHIWLWDNLWKYIIKLPVPGPVTTNPNHDTTMADMYSSADGSSYSKTQLPFVNIIPFSPLMVSLKATTEIPLNGTYTYDDQTSMYESQWCKLARLWSGRIKPNVTVLIQNSQEIRLHGIEDQNTNNILVTKRNPEYGGLTGKQLRRVGFEVKEWLRQD